jgi:hypothetical protein
MGASLPTEIKACFNGVEISQFTFNQKVEGNVISWEGYAYVFCDTQRVLLAHFQKLGENINCVSCCEVLLRLRDAIRRKLPVQLARGVLLRHDNARPHTARATQKRIQELQWGTFYGPSDIHMFGPLKSHLIDKRFADNEEVETEVRKWLIRQSKTSALPVSTHW